ncbi:hypothetical protein [Xanthomonas cannabis]|uniref:Uncharacterized protein n=1 Tax=Xanthomonas cannabis TaxID=1885674 RepID=A0ABR6JQI7_9XANT|nr:hypothetical protein [Xanthomonas cannabis]MBB4594512.1 hypothetical protein [Xanthomonas cannabis]MBB5521518.1 hypothetical protein [Xanthomonas cannabis]
MDINRDNNELLRKRDEAVQERNKVIALLARLFPAGISQTRVQDNNGRAQNCVLIDLPTGQISWHFGEEDADYFQGLPAYLGHYDGHSQEEKYKRLEQWTKMLDLGEARPTWRAYSSRKTHAG